MSLSKKIGLGTVQFGLPYGNRADCGLVDPDEVERILQIALNEGINFFDTARAYGESEKRIGDFNLQSRNQNVLISTKVPVVERAIWSNEKAFYTFISNMVSDSQFILKVPRIKLLQFHQCDLDFLTSSSVKNVIRKLIEQKITESIGISVYEVEQALAAMGIAEVSHLQVPINLVDRRFLSREFLTETKKNDIRLIARSIFLQGLLVSKAPLPRVKRLDKLSILKNLLLEAQGQVFSSRSLEETSLRYLLGNHVDDIDIVLIGVDSEDSMRQNMSIVRQIASSLSFEEVSLFDRACQYSSSNELYNPGNWNR